MEFGEGTLVKNIIFMVYWLKVIYYVKQTQHIKKQIKEKLEKAKMDAFWVSLRISRHDRISNKKLEIRWRKRELSFRILKEDRHI